MIHILPWVLSAAGSAFLADLLERRRARRHENALREELSAAKARARDLEQRLEWEQAFPGEPYTLMKYMDWVLRTDFLEPLREELSKPSLLVKELTARYPELAEATGEMLIPLVVKGRE